MNDTYIEVETNEEVAKLHNAINAAAAAIHEVWDTGCLPVEELSATLVGRLTEEQRADLMFQILGSYLDPETGDLTKAGKKFAIEFADCIGPDWTQGVYKFGVAVSRA